MHYGSRRNGRTLFVGLEILKPWPDPWDVLQNVRRNEPERLRQLLERLRPVSASDLLPWMVRETQPLRFPNSVKVVRYDAHYIETIGLNRSFSIAFITPPSN